MPSTETEHSTVKTEIRSSTEEILYFRYTTRNLP